MKVLEIAEEALALFIDAAFKAGGIALLPHVDKLRAAVKEKASDAPAVEPSAVEKVS